LFVYKYMWGYSCFNSNQRNLKGPRQRGRTRSGQILERRRGGFPPFQAAGAGVVISLWIGPAHVASQPGPGVGRLLWDIASFYYSSSALRENKFIFGNSLNDYWKFPLMFPIVVTVHCNKPAHSVRKWMQSLLKYAIARRVVTQLGSLLKCTDWYRTVHL
jgi:hypothetical protein